jgi:hypothetical protein
VAQAVRSDPPHPGTWCGRCLLVRGGWVFAPGGLERMIRWAAGEPWPWLRPGLHELAVGQVVRARSMRKRT